MSASREDLKTIFRQLFVRNMSAADAIEASERFLALYFADTTIDMSDANVAVNSLSATNNVNCTIANATTSVNTATVNATSAVNSVVVRGSTSVNTATVNATTAVNTVAFIASGNAQANNLIATNFVNAATVNATTAVNTVAFLASGNAQANNLIATNFVNAATVNATTAVNTATVNATTAVNTAGNVNAGQFNLPYCCFKTAKHTLTNINGGTCSQVAAVIAGTLVLGVEANITANVVGATSINVGDGTTDNCYGILSAVTAGTNFTWGTWAPGTTPWRPVANTNVVLTAVGGGTDFDGNGNVDIFITYLDPKGV